VYALGEAEHVPLYDGATCSVKRLARREALGLTLTAPLALCPSPVGARGSLVRIGVGLDDAFMQPYWAADLGLFRRAEIDARIMTVGPVAAVPGAVGGSIDVGMADPVVMALAILRGFRLGYFAGGPLATRENPTLQLCVARSSPIRTAKALEGKTVGIISLRSLMQITTMQWMRENGADASQVRFVEMRFTEMTPSLLRGTVDAAMLGEPFLTENRAELRTLGVPFDTVAPAFTIFGWFARIEWLAANEVLAHRLATVLYETARWANGHRDESAVIEAKYTKIPVEVARKMERNPLATALRTADIQPVLDIANRYRLLDRAMTAAELIAPGFA
jgi:NitT/TauT family transport system substrate-binding protein